MQSVHKWIEWTFIPGNVDWCLVDERTFIEIIKKVNLDINHCNSEASLGGWPHFILVIGVIHQQIPKYP